MPKINYSNLAEELRKRAEHYSPESDLIKTEVSQNLYPTTRGLLVCAAEAIESLNLKPIVEEKDFEVIDHMYFSKNYTIYVPETVERLVVYFNDRSEFKHESGRHKKDEYSTQEDIASKIFSDNHNTAVLVFKHEKDTDFRIIKDHIYRYCKFNTPIVFSGCGIGAVDAIDACMHLMNSMPQYRNLTIFMINTDSIGLNKIPLDSCRRLKDMNVDLVYMSNVISKPRLRKLNKIVQFGSEIKYIYLDVPKQNRADDYAYCRNSVFIDNVYGYIFGYHSLPSVYVVGAYASQHKDVQFIGQSV